MLRPTPTPKEPGRREAESELHEIIEKNPWIGLSTEMKEEGRRCCPSLSSTSLWLWSLRSWGRVGDRKRTCTFTKIWTVGRDRVSVGLSFLSVITGFAHRRMFVPSSPAEVPSTWNLNPAFASEALTMVEVLIVDFHSDGWSELSSSMRRDSMNVLGVISISRVLLTKDRRVVGRSAKWTGSSDGNRTEKLGLETHLQLKPLLRNTFFALRAPSFPGLSFITNPSCRVGVIPSLQLSSLAHRSGTDVTTFEVFGWRIWTVDSDDWIRDWLVLASWRWLKNCSGKMLCWMSF